MMINKIKTASIILMTFFLFNGCVSIGAKIKITKNTTIKEKQSFSNYTVCIYEDKNKDFNYVEIIRSNEPVFTMEGNIFKFGAVYDELKNASLLKMGNDINGDEKPELVISEYTGGAHCCFNYYIFSIDKTFKPLAVIEGAHGDLAHFEDVDHDGALEYLGNDWAFSYWNACFSESPAPEIILKYRNSRYLLTLDLMKKPLPTSEAEERNIKNIQNDIERLKGTKKENFKKPLNRGFFGDEDTGNFVWHRKGVMLPSSVWSHMLDLIYTGHPKEAREFLNKIWPNGEQGKEEFLSDFEKQLSTSLYWDSVKKSLGTKQIRIFLVRMITIK